MALRPINTDKQQRALVASNRRRLARRWPTGKLKVCERLDELYPGWLAMWLPENRTWRFAHPAGYTMQWRGHDTLPGGDQLHPGPEDHVRRRPRVFAPSIAALEERTYEMQRRIWSECGLRTLPTLDEARQQQRVAAAREWRDDERRLLP